ncbi:hypothetical protein [Amycolatopsis taiwanensis]|uniref:hypothetical protein n=1 Tax=Amycolatopsis taiwanensis TaxID=342230 RepID=UPI000484A32A|nr:hypothetical protein [Amycolatopsis taiwanensis]
MDHVLADLAIQEADLLPARLTLATINDSFFSELNNMVNVHATNMAIGQTQQPSGFPLEFEHPGQTIAVQNIRVH